MKKLFLIIVLINIFFISNLLANANKYLTLTELRILLAKNLAEMFSQEVPEYAKFKHIIKQTNLQSLKNSSTKDLVKQNRIMSEKHGAIRVGTVEEMRMVTRIFAVLGMHPVEFYDMTKIPKGALPIIATAFRPIDNTIELNAFRMFCSMLHPDFITEDIKDISNQALAARGEGNPKFSIKLKKLLIQAEQQGLNKQQANIFIKEIVNAFKINKDQAIDFKLYKKLRQKNDVLADIIAVGININHLTPRILNINQGVENLKNAKVNMKDGGIEGPSIRQNAVQILLNQTSSKASREIIWVTKNNHIKLLNYSPKEFKKLKQNAPKIKFAADQTLAQYLEYIDKILDKNLLVGIEHRARFGEIESRGAALTAKGEKLYFELVNKQLFTKEFPKTHFELFVEDLAYYNLKSLDGRKYDINDKKEVIELIDQNKLALIPLTYEDFLATSAAGIFKSNLTNVNSLITTSTNIKKDNNRQLLEQAIGKKIIDKHNLYQNNSNHLIIN